MVTRKLNPIGWAVVGVSLVATAAGRQPAPPSPRSDPTHLDGTWSLIAVERDGKRTDTKKGNTAPMQLTITGDSLKVESGVPFVFYSATTGTFKVVRADGKTLRVNSRYKGVTTTVNRDEVKKEDVTEGSVRELWELVDKDTLRICRPASGGGRPDGFVTKAGDGRAIYLFARVNDAPQSPAPKLWRASASGQGDQVVIQLSEPKECRGAGGEVVWDDLPKLTLGKTASAFHIDGKWMEPDAVVKALGKPRGVAVFVRRTDRDPKVPEDFYLAMLREGTVVLVVRGQDIYPDNP